MAEEMAYKYDKIVEKIADIVFPSSIVIFAILGFILGISNNGIGAAIFYSMVGGVIGAMVGGIFWFIISGSRYILFGLLGLGIFIGFITFIIKFW